MITGAAGAACRAVAGARERRWHAGGQRSWGCVGAPMHVRKHADERHHANLYPTRTSGFSLNIVGCCVAARVQRNCTLSIVFSLSGIGRSGLLQVAAAAAEGHRVVPVPGPSAVLAALVASGLPTAEFMFIGFLPAKAAARLRKLRQLAGEGSSWLQLESPCRHLTRVCGHVGHAITALPVCCLW